MFSAQVRSGSLVIFCGITPMLLRTALGSRITSYPATVAVPLVGGTNVVSMRISVLLPAPFGPSKPKISPLCTVKLTLSTASSAPKRLANAFHINGDVWGLGLRRHDG